MLRSGDMEIESHNSAHATKCDHGVHWPAKDAAAYSCQQCNPDGTGAGDAPVLPRSSGDPLNSTKTDKSENCGVCGCIRTYFSSTCLACGTVLPPTDARGRQQGAANAVQSGVCPECGSNVHYETAKKGTWQCSDCDAKYPAPKRLQLA